MVEDQDENKEDRFQRLRKLLAGDPVNAAGFISGFRRAALEQAELAAFIRKETRETFLLDFVRRVASETFSPPGSSSRSIQARLLGALKDDQRFDIAMLFSEALETRTKAAEAEIARAILGEGWERDLAAADDRRIIYQMLIDPQSTLPSAEVMQRVIEELAAGRLTFLEDFFHQRARLHERLSSYDAQKSVSVVDGDGLVRKGSRHPNARSSRIVGVSNFVACIIEFWTDEDLPLWLMTKSAAVTAVNLLLRDERISEANYKKIVRTLGFTHRSWAPIRELEMKIDPKTRRPRFQRLKFTRGIQDRVMW